MTAKRVTSVAVGTVLSVLWVVFVWWALAVSVEPGEQARLAQIASRVFYRLAYRLGRAGMAAERAYWEAIERARV